MVAWHTTNLGVDVTSSETNAHRTRSLLSRSGMLLEIVQFEGLQQRSIASVFDMRQVRSECPGRWLALRACRLDMRSGIAYRDTDAPWGDKPK